MMKTNIKDLKKLVPKKGEPFVLEIGNLKISPGKKFFKRIVKLSERVTDKKFKQDSCLINSGYEGSGKTNASLIEAALIHHLTGFPINLFFKTSSALKFLQSTEEQIVILDEPSLESLSTDTRNNLNRDFLRLTSTMRKKRHVLLINFAKFWKFPDFLVVDRPLGMLHMKGTKKTDLGRFIYIPKKRLEQLWRDKKSKNLLSYEKLKSFRGNFAYLMEDIFANLKVRVEAKENASYDDYEDEKDRAIESIGKGKEKINKYRAKLLDLRHKIANLKGISKEDLAPQLGIHSRRLREWAKMSPTAAA